MTLTDALLTKLVTPKPGPHTTKLPRKSARTNAALIAGIKAAQALGSVKG